MHGRSPNVGRIKRKAFSCIHPYCKLGKLLTMSKDSDSLDDCLSFSSCLQSLEGEGAVTNGNKLITAVKNGGEINAIY